MRFNRNNLLAVNYRPLECSIFILPVMNPSHRRIGSIDAQLHAVFPVFIPEHFCHDFISMLIPNIEERWCCEHIRGFLIYDKPVEVPGNPVVCIAQRVVGILFLFLVFKLVFHQNIRFIPVVPFRLHRPQGKPCMPRFVFSYEFFHYLKFHVLTSISKCWCRHDFRQYILRIG